MKRAAILVDGDNVFNVVRKTYSSRIDYRALIEIISEGKEVVRKIAYITASGDSKGSLAFVKALKHLGFEIRLLQSYTHNNRRKKQTCEVPLTIDAMLIAPKVDVIAIVSGNGSLIPLVEHLTSERVMVEVYGFSRSTAVGLKKRASLFIALDGYTDKILLPPGGKRTGGEFTEEGTRRESMGEGNPPTEASQW